jgi:hypothetical protein
MDNILQQIWQQIADDGLHAVLEAVITCVLAPVTALLVRSLVWRGKVWIGTDAGLTSISPLVLVFSVLSAVIAVVALAAGSSSGMRSPRPMISTRLGGVGRLHVAWLAGHAGAVAPHVGVGCHGPALAWRLVEHGDALGRSGAHRQMANGQLFVVDVTGSKVTWSTRHTLEHEALRVPCRTVRLDFPPPA